MTEEPDQVPEPVPTEGLARAVPLTSEDHTGAADRRDPPGPSRAARRTRARERRRALRDWVILIGIALVVAVVVRQFVFQLFYIPSGSMEPRLEVHDQVFVNKLAYDIGDPARGDVVVFARPPNWSDVPVEDLVKRIVGLPGETIEGRAGHVYVDGHRLAEPYLPKGTSTSSFGPLTVPPHEYFMMGDNRSGSNDSRMHTAVDRDEFVGKVFMTVWPLDRISVPSWVTIGVVGGVAVLVAVWVLAGRRNDLRRTASR